MIEGQTAALALSGGGYRASLFGLGSLWRLNDAGLLGDIDRMTSVSGGSITLGVLAHRWSKLVFENKRAINFVEQVAKPVQEFCTRSIDAEIILAGAATPFKTAGDYLEDYYEKYLFGKTLMNELPRARDGHPKFIIYATNMQTGRSFRFRQDMMADYMLGTCGNASIKLATAVAASSAFPPLLSPIVLEDSKNNWQWESGEKIPHRDVLRRRIVLTDGGVYDNMGLESALKAKIVLVSDAGAPFDIDDDPSEGNVGQLSRVRDILIDQTRALRKRWFMSELGAGTRRGAYWGIGTRIQDYADEHSPFKDTEVTNGLAAVKTRLKAFEPRVRGCLINWGYVLCDVALRKRAAIAVPVVKDLPLPEWPLH